MYIKSNILAPQSFLKNVAASYRDVLFKMYRFSRNQYDSNNFKNKQRLQKELISIVLRKTEIGPIEDYLI